MADDDKPQGYCAYRVRGVPAGHFGETYVITTGAIGDDGIHSFEFFLVSKRHNPHLYRDRCQFEPGDVPEDLLKVDEDYLLSEAHQLAQNYLDEALYQLADLHGDYVLDRYRPELVEISNMPLLSLWFRGELQEEIQTIAQETSNPRLRQLVELVTKSRVRRRG